MRSVWKFPLQAHPDTRVEKLGDDGSIVLQVRMPDQARVLSVQFQGDVPTLWALVEPGAKRKLRIFVVLVTGCEVDELATIDGASFVGTIQHPTNGLVFHVFDHGYRSGKE